MTFLFRWKHDDGSVVEFSERGWRSNDSEKSEWLIKISELYSSYPVLAPPIRIWLQESCQLVEFIGPKDPVRPIVKIPYDSSSELGKLEALARAVNGGIAPNFSNRSSLFRPTRRKARITIRSIDLACDDFFRSRGMPQKENFNGR